MAISNIISARWLGASALGLLLVGCGSGGGGGSSSTAEQFNESPQKNPTYQLGGNVSGLQGSLLLSNGGDVIGIDANGGYQFEQEYEIDVVYDVNIAEQPGNLSCLVENGFGAIDGTIANVDIVCAPRQLLSDLVFDDNNLSDCIREYAEDNSWQYVDEMTALDCNTQGIESAEGVNQLTRLKILDLSVNAITELNVSGMTELVALDIAAVPTTESPIDLFTALAINIFYAGLPDFVQQQLQQAGLFSDTGELNNDEALASEIYILISEFTDVLGNSVEHLDLSDSPKLVSLNVFGNQIDALDQARLANLQALNYGANGLGDFELDGLADLQELILDGNKFAEFSLDAHQSIRELSLNSMDLVSLSLTDVDLLANLSVRNNLLETIDLGTLDGLKSLDISDNPLTEQTIDELLDAESSGLDLTL